MIEIKQRDKVKILTKGQEIEIKQRKGNKDKAKKYRQNFKKITENIQVVRDRNKVISQNLVGSITILPSVIDSG